MRSPVCVYVAPVHSFFGQYYEKRMSGEAVSSVKIEWVLIICLVVVWPLFYKGCLSYKGRMAVTD